MGEKYLIDTNILIYYLGGKLKGKAKTFVRKVIKNSFNISIITKIELLSYSKLSKKDITHFNEFLSKSRIYSLDDSLSEQVIKIRKSKKVKIPDAIIAATAIDNKLTLITRNAEDFKSIKGLSYINPFD